jgi:asparagine synthase (glutamine-hydrolysing)
VSAIFGILRFDGREAAASDMERMGEALAHRGPDGRRFAVDGPIALGHCLMRVTVEDDFEAQPVCGGGVMLIADARLDNRSELARDLAIADTALAALSDSALAHAAYRHWGADFGAHLIGDFAIAVWDGTKLLLARDHMGQRGFVFHRGAGFFAFASEVKALWSLSDVPRELSEDEFARLIVHDKTLNPGATPFVGIAGIGGGMTMTVAADGRLATQSYWEPHADPAHCGKDEAYYVDAYRRVLGEAVACRLRRLKGTPGLVFSGGYDSAAIAGLAGRVLEPAGKKLAAAASVMPADYRGTIRHARRWVDLCVRDMPWLDVRYVTREGKNTLSGLDRRWLESGTPNFSYGFVQDELNATLAGAGARLIMDGHGGDYTLNPRGQSALAWFLARGRLIRFGREFIGQLRRSERSLWQTLKSDIAGILAPPAIRRWYRRRTPLWNGAPIAAGFAADLAARGVLHPDRIAGRVHDVLAMRVSMIGVLRRIMERPIAHGAAEAARYGLELTRPFHDKRVVELGLAIPEDLDVKDGRNRYLACRALESVYPREFQTRWRLNDDLIPDFQRMAKSIEPQILAEIARMEQSESLTRMFDFAKIRALLAARGIDDHNSGWEQETQIALHGFLAARYVEWFSRRNR